MRTSSRGTLDLRGEEDQTQVEAMAEEDTTRIDQGITINPPLDVTFARKTIMTSKIIGFVSAPIAKMKIIKHEEDLSLNAAENMDESMLWQCRYGHLNYPNLKELNKKDMVIRLPSIQSSNGVCEGCVYGKMHKLPFPTSA
ncbi:hypothetical protein RJ639_015840 [Escallonia herrerae]|uniref:GAG-pre-integrase domain-containing protein n=1 Tax=Escallonia herrerae TaxID=1293975 RepID=A0AA89ANU4_9ASTE|nr:hypothetical protein RJ639_015840 [Escallonia herrerae]